MKGLLRALPAAGLLAFGFALGVAAPAAADDCASRLHSVQDISQAGNVQDCMRTGQTFGVAVGVIVGSAGVIIAIAGLPGRTPMPPPRPVTPQPVTPQPQPSQQTVQQRPQHADPCFDQQVRWSVARTHARATFNTLQTLRTERAYLETLWETTRETGYLNSVIDVAMMAGSLWSKPAAAAIGVTLAKQSVASKAIESILKPLGKELAKDLVRHLEDQNIDWKDLLSKIGDSRTGAIYGDLIKEQLTKIEFDRQVADLAGTGKTPDLAEIEKEFAEPLTKAVSQALSVAGLASSTFKVSEKLSEIRKAISSVDDHISIAEELWQHAVDETDLANDSLSRCRDLHGAAPPMS